MSTPKKFTVLAVKWFDKVNGNTYHSVRCIRHKDGAVITAPFQYGYGDHYRQTALHTMLDANWIPKKYGDKLPHDGTKVMSFERENNYPIIWSCHYGLKKDCVANGQQ